MKLGKGFANAKSFSTFFVLFFIIISLTLLSGCGNTDSTKTLSIPVATDAAGYELVTDRLTYTNLIDEDVAYQTYISKESQHAIELYEDSTQYLIIDTSEAGKQYYIESKTETETVKSDALLSVFDSLRTLQFNWTEFTGTHDVFHTTKIENYWDTEQIAYTKYLIQCVWLDQNSYRFSYYVYEDGATLISAEAPTEINDRLTPDTNWCIDLEEAQIKNSATNEVISFKVAQTTTGKATSPNGTGTQKQEITQIYVYTDPQTDDITSITYQESDAENLIRLNIIESADLTMPELSSEMTPLDEDTLQRDLLLLEMLSSLTL